MSWWRAKEIRYTNSYLLESFCDSKWYISFWAGKNMLWSKANIWDARYLSLCPWYSHMQWFLHYDHKPFLYLPVPLRHIAKSRFPAYHMLVLKNKHYLFFFSWVTQQFFCTLLKINFLGISPKSLQIVFTIIFSTAKFSCLGHSYFSTIN